LRRCSVAIKDVLSGFKDFIARGNVIDLAVAVVIGAAFTGVVQAFVKDVLTPLIAAIFGKQDFSNLTFTINGSEFRYGDLVNALINFVLVAAAIYFFVVVPMNQLAERRNHGIVETPTTRECPECLTLIPIAARRCAACGIGSDPRPAGSSSARPTPV
jgi:large conductance mechanosensitive channel